MLAKKWMKVQFGPDHLGFNTSGRTDTDGVCESMFYLDGGGQIVLHLTSVSYVCQDGRKTSIIKFTGQRAKLPALHGWSTEYMKAFVSTIEKAAANFPDGDIFEGYYYPNPYWGYIAAKNPHVNELLGSYLSDAFADSDLDLESVINNWKEVGSSE